MAGSTTLTIRLDSAVRDQLGRLADATRRTKSFLAAEAVAAYVAREAEIVEGIGEGLEDMRAGRVVPHETAMARLAAVIAKAEKHGG